MNACGGVDRGRDRPCVTEKLTGLGQAAAGPDDGRGSGVAKPMGMHELRKSGPP